MGQQCECGQDRGNALTCKRCRFLDGAHINQRRLIALMREHDRVTTTEVEQSLAICNRGAVLALQVLMTNGRARRDVIETERGTEASYALISTTQVAIRDKP